MFLHWFLKHYLNAKMECLPLSYALLNVSYYEEVGGFQERWGMSKGPQRQHGEASTGQIWHNFNIQTNNYRQGL